MEERIYSPEMTLFRANEFAPPCRLMKHMYKSQNYLLFTEKSPQQHTS